MPKYIESLEAFEDLSDRTVVFCFGDLLGLRSDYYFVGLFTNIPCVGPDVRREDKEKIREEVREAFSRTSFSGELSVEIAYIPNRADGFFFSIRVCETTCGYSRVVELARELEEQLASSVREEKFSVSSVFLTFRLVRIDLRCGETVLDAGALQDVSDVFVWVDHGDLGIERGACLSWQELKEKVQEGLVNGALTFRSDHELMRGSGSACDLDSLGSPGEKQPAELLGGE